MKNELFSLPKNIKKTCQKVTGAFIYLLDNIYIRFGSKHYRQNVGIPMGTNCDPLVADLFLFCYEKDFMKSLTKEKRYDMTDAFNSTSRYSISIIFTLNIWFTEYIPLNFNLWGSSNK